MASFEQEELAQYYQGLANQAEDQAKRLADVEAVGLAERQRQASNIESLKRQQQNAFLQTDKDRLANSIRIQEAKLKEIDSSIVQLQTQRTAAQAQVTANQNLANEAVGGPPAAQNIPGPAAVPAPPAPPPATIPVTPAAAPAAAPPLPPLPPLPPPPQVAPLPLEDFVTDPNTGEQVPSDSAQAAEIRASSADRIQANAPEPVLSSTQADGEFEGVTGNQQFPPNVPPNVSVTWDSESGSWAVFDNDTGQVLRSGFPTEEQAQASADNRNLDLSGSANEGDAGDAEARLVFGPAQVPGNFTAVSDPEGTPPNNWAVWNDDTGVSESTGLTEQQARLRAENLSLGVDEPFPQGTPGGTGLTPEEQQARDEAARIESLRNQATRQSVYKQTGTSDWRVRLQLAPRSTSLYNASPAGILAPLAATNGVIFPYTPAIQTTYRANYTNYDLVHSNFRGVFYQSSRVDDINLRATFTAQDTREADYLLATIHFFRSVTKMFYGQDAQRGTPPPLVYLSGLGMNQFYGHPCLVSAFQYSLPDNVDYIRATNVNNYGTDLLNRRTPSKSNAAAGLGATGNRILNAGLEKFFPSKKPAPDSVVGTVNNTQLANYVPTMMEIDLVLIPVQTRSQVSKQFSLDAFASGDLIKKGFW